MIGASWSGQFFAFLISFAFGLSAGVPALLFLRTARPLERTLTDFVAIIAMTGLYLASLELGNDGRFAAFTLIAFLAATPIIPIAVKVIKKRLKFKKEKRKLN